MQAGAIIDNVISLLPSELDDDCIVFIALTPYTLPPEAAMYKKSTLLLVSLLTCASYAHAEPGETWEVTSKAEVAGMPGMMPASTMTVCQAKASGPDPQRMQEDKNCKISDVKNSGSKVTWKVRCKGDGQDLTGSGEITSSKSSYQGTMQMSGTSDGEKMSMKVNYSGKRIGQACDTSTPVGSSAKGMEEMNEMMGMAKAQMEADMAEQCEVSRYEATGLMSSMFFGPNAMCAKNQKYACKVIGKDVMKKPEVYIAMTKHDDTSDTSIAKACKIDMKAATSAICKKVDESNYEDLEEACPTEAAKFVAAAAAGRSYSSMPRSEEAVTDSTVGNVIDGAKKLKGLFGF